MSFKRKQALSTKSASELKRKKKAISESTVNSQVIGIMLKLEAIKTTLSRSKKSFTDVLYSTKIIHFLMYFIETRQVGLVQESANYGNATKKGQTSNTICANT